MSPTQSEGAAKAPPQTPSMGRAALWALGALGLEVLGLGAAYLGGPLGYGAAAGAHITAAWASRIAGRTRSGASRSELDVAMLVALGIPVVGIALAWLLPRSLNSAQAVDAHEAFEEKRGGENSAESGLSGNRSDDLRGRLDVESDEHALRYGDTQRRTDLVRKLGDRGRPQDHELLWCVLDDQEEELRIQAFQRLRQARRNRQETIEALTSRHSEESSETSALDLAEAHLDLAKSKVLDPALARIELNAALGLARSIEPADPKTASRACALRLDAASALGSTGEAALFASDLRLDLRFDPLQAKYALVAWAELAIRHKNKQPVLDVAARLVAAGLGLPAWMEEVARARPQAPLESVAP